MAFFILVLVSLWLVRYSYILISMFLQFTTATAGFVVVSNLISYIFSCFETKRPNLADTIDDGWETIAFTWNVSFHKIELFHAMDGIFGPRFVLCEAYPSRWWFEEPMSEKINGEHLKRLARGTTTPAVKAPEGIKPQNADQIGDKPIMNIIRVNPMPAGKILIATREDIPSAVTARSGSSVKNPSADTAVENYPKQGAEGSAGSEKVPDKNDPHRVSLGETKDSDTVPDHSACSVVAARVQQNEPWVITALDDDGAHTFPPSKKEGSVTVPDHSACSVVAARAPQIRSAAHKIHQE